MSFWSKIKENLASFKVWAFAALLIAVRLIPGMNEAQASVLNNLAYLAFGANVATNVIKTAGEVMALKYQRLDPIAGEPGVVQPAVPLAG